MTFFSLSSRGNGVEADPALQGIEIWISAEKCSWTYT